MWWFKVTLNWAVVFVKALSSEEATKKLETTPGGHVFGPYDFINQAEKASEDILVADEYALGH